MGDRDKGLVEIDGARLIDHVTARLAPQVDEFIISCNRNPTEYARYGTPVPDIRQGFAGPLAGIASAAPHTSHDLNLVVPCDMPALPFDLCERLLGSLAGHSAVFVHDGTRSQHLVILMKKSVVNTIEPWLETGDKSVKGWIQQIDAPSVDFSDCPGAFRNINRLN